MQTFVAIKTCDGSIAAFNNLASAKQARANLIIETDDQFSPRKTIRAWVLAACADCPANWMETDTQWANNRIADMVIYNATHTWAHRAA